MSRVAQINIGNKFGSPWIGAGDYTLGNFVGLVVQWAIIIAGVIMIFLIIGGGFMLISGAGQNKPESAAKGKKAVTAAVFGFIIIVGAYLIVGAIEAMLGSDFVF